MTAGFTASANGPLPKAVAEKMEEGARAIGWEGELLIVGISPIEDSGSEFIGWLKGSTWDPWWGRAAVGKWIGSESDEKNSEGRLGFCHDEGSYRDRITGCYDGGSSGGSILEPGFVRNLWNRAASRVRWEPG